MTSWKGQGPTPEDIEPGDDISMHIPVYYPSFVHRAIEILLPHINRWSKFNMITLDPALITLALDYVTHFEGAPILERLNLAVDRPDVKEIDEMPEDYYEGALFKGNDPQLTHVHLTSTPVDWSGPLFTHLEVYDLCKIRPSTGPWFDSLRDTFETSPKLKELGFRDASPQVDEKDGWPDFQTVKLKNLESLVIEFADPDETGKLLRRLCLPYLWHLRLSFGKPFGGDPRDLFDLEEPHATQFRQSMTRTLLSKLSMPQWHKELPKNTIFGTIFTLQLVNAGWDWKRKDESEDAVRISTEMLKELDPRLSILTLHKASPSFVKLLTTERPKKKESYLTRHKKAYCPKLRGLVVGDLGDRSIAHLVRSRHRLGSPLQVLVAPRRMEKEIKGEGLLQWGLLREVEYYGEDCEKDLDEFVKHRFFDMVKSRTVSSSNIFLARRFIHY